MKPGAATATAALLVASAQVGCGLLGEEGSGVIIERRIQVSERIDRVEVSDAFRATVRTGATDPSGTIQIDDNLIDHLRVEVDGDTLTISLDGDVRDATLRADLDIAGLERIGASGAVQVRVDGEVTDDLTVEASGASDVVVSSAELDELGLDLSGASHAEMQGSTSHLDADVSGASQLALFDLEVEDARIDVSGASSAEVTVVGELEATASGASSVRYRGEPARVISDVSGASSIESA